MAAAKNHSEPAIYRRCLLLLLSMNSLSLVVFAADSPLCSIPSPVPMHVSAGKETLPLIHSFRLSAGYFFGGEDIHFAKDESDGSVFHLPRSFTLLPLQVHGTANSTVIHVAATLTLSGDRAFHAVAAHRRNRFGGGSGSHSVSFHLDGYYYSTSEELCMIGSGTYYMDDGWPRHLPDVALRLRVPSPPSLKDPFITGKLKGAGFDAITLVSYAEGDRYEYGQRATCAPLQPPSDVRGALQALGANFSCAHLREQLMSSYKMQYGGGAPASSTSPALLRLQEPRMHVGHVQCTADGAVRVYATFSSDTNLWGLRYRRSGPSFMVKEAAVVAEGRWDSTLNTLCLRACRVVRSGPMSLAVQQEEDCGIGMSFWFPAVWTIRERSILAGRLWNSSQGTAAGSNASAPAAGAISASSIEFDNNGDDFSDVKYRYTKVDEAEKRYRADVLRSHENKAKGGPFPSANYTYHDFQFRFYVENGVFGVWRSLPCYDRLDYGLRG